MSGIEVAKHVAKFESISAFLKNAVESFSFGNSGEKMVLDNSLQSAGALGQKNTLKM